MDENSLTHYGVLGMKWGRRKQKVSKGSNTKKSSKSKKSSKKMSNIKKKIQNITSKVDKEKVKSIAKATAKVAGTVAVTSLLGYTGSVAMNEINRLRSENAGLQSDLKSEKANRIDAQLGWQDASYRAEHNRLAGDVQKARADGVSNIIDVVSKSNLPSDTKVKYISDYSKAMDFVASGGAAHRIDETLKLKRK